MNKRLLIFAVVVLMATVVTRTPNAGAASTKTLTAKITGSANPPLTGACTTGADGDSYDTICPSGDCLCIVAPNMTVTGTLAGTGTATLTESYDIGDVDTTTDPNFTCVPIFGVIDLSTKIKKVAHTETLNIAGVFCNTANPSQNYEEAGFGVSQTPAPSPDPVSGDGTATGLYTNGAGTLTLKGPITQ
jgi:hypothetical protein